MDIYFILCVIIQHSLTYLLLKGSFCVFLAPVLELVISPRNPTFFLIGEWF